MLFFMFGFQFIPPIAPLSHQGMQGVGIFIGLLWAWTFIDFIWPSFLGIVAVGYTGFMTVDQAFTTGFGDTTFIMVAACLILAAYMTSTGICKTVSYWFVSRKACVGKPYMFMFLFFVAMYILGGTAGALAAFVIGWAIVYSTAELLGYKKGDTFVTSLLVGSVVSAVFGGTVFLFRAFPAMAINNARNLVGLDCNFVDWFVPNFVASFVAMIMYIFAIKFIIRPDASKYIAGGDIFGEYRKELTLTNEQKVAILLLCVVIFVAALPGFLPAGNAIKVFMSKLSIGPLIAISLSVLYAIRINGKPLINYPEIMKNGVDWSTMVMLAASFPVAKMLQHADSGFTVLINDILISLLGNYGPYMIAVVFVMFTIILTQFAHNLVMMIVLCPIICNLSIIMGFNPLPTLMMVAFAAQMGIGTAGASVMGAMLFANREWIPTGQCFKFTWLAVLVTIVCICAIGIPIANLMGVGTPV